MSWLQTVDALSRVLQTRARHWICFLQSETPAFARHPSARDWSFDGISQSSPNRSAADTESGAHSGSALQVNNHIRCVFIAHPKLLRSELVPQSFFMADSNSHATTARAYLIPFFSLDAVHTAQTDPCLEWEFTDVIELSGLAHTERPEVRVQGSLMADLKSFEAIKKVCESGSEQQILSGSAHLQAWQITQSADALRQMIDHLQIHMQQGDYYLANATTRLLGPQRTQVKIHLSDFVREWLSSPVRFGVFVDCGENLPRVCCFSPERFISRRGAHVQTEPIKGTAPVQPGDPQFGASALWLSEKEMNEQTLVTDLLRNDLNKVCAPGTVKVVSPYEIHSNSALLQMQSVVTGQLAHEDLPHVRLLGELLPAGSITGTPKWAVSREVCNIESTPRGYYTGIFALAPSPTQLDSTILIRGFFADKTRWKAGLGAGITTLSEPELEVRELDLKWRSFAARWQRMVHRSHADSSETQGDHADNEKAENS